MGWRLKRSIKNFLYSIRRRRLPKLGLLKSLTFLTLLIISFAIFILAGGVYDVLEKPLAILPRGGGYTFIYRGSIHYQTINESLVIALVYLLGLSGLYVIFRSTRFAYKPRNAYLMLIIGMSITFLAFYYGQALLREKLG
ncbi:MAG: hypothetical protein QW265_04965 [Candidatus Bathyarchaeia archaeon]